MKNRDFLRRYLKDNATLLEEDGAVEVWETKHTLFLMMHKILSPLEVLGYINQHGKGCQWCLEIHPLITFQWVKMDKENSWEHISGNDLRVKRARFFIEARIKCYGSP